MRVRLQLWYALVLLVVVCGFAAGLYMQARFTRMRTTDARLRATAANLAVAVRGLMPHEWDPRFPPPPRHEHHPGPPDGGFRGPDSHEPEPRGPGFEGHGPHADDRGPNDRPAEGPRHGPPFGPRDLPPVEQRLQSSLAAWQEPEPPHDRPYFVVRRADGGLLAASPTAPKRLIGPHPDDGPRRTLDAVPKAGPRPGPEEPGGFSWQPELRRELRLEGPRDTLILVGKPMGRELAELRTLAWQLLGLGLLVLSVGLAGGWLISRSITRPIAAIEQTAASISANNLTRRLDETGIDRELVGLATVLNAMFGRLEAAFERQSRFTSDASHELRTPLAVIHSHAELALTKPRSGEEYRETLTACLKAAGRMATLVDGLLTLARADAGRLDLHFRAVDLGTLAADLIEQYRPQAESSELALRSTLAPEVVVQGDPSLLARILSNLLSNALRYTPAGGEVQVIVAAEAGQALLAVADTGTGIPVEDQSKVFERFYRADKARSRAAGGTGLGLAICQSLVEAHHGTIGFTSQPGHGTRFEVRIPLAARANATSAAPLTHPA